MEVNELMHLWVSDEEGKHRRLLRETAALAAASERRFLTIEEEIKEQLGLMIAFSVFFLLIAYLILRSFYTCLLMDDDSYHDGSQMASTTAMGDSDDENSWSSVSIEEKGEVDPDSEDHEKKGKSNGPSTQTGCRQSENETDGETDQVDSTLAMSFSLSSTSLSTHSGDDVKYHAEWTERDRNDSAKSDSGV